MVSNGKCVNYLNQDMTIIKLFAKHARANSSAQTSRNTEIFMGEGGL